MYPKVNVGTLCPFGDRHSEKWLWCCRNVQLCLCVELIWRTRWKELQKVFSRLLYTFSVHNITVTHNVLLSEHTLTEHYNIIIQLFII
jgi:hypothetical protein